MADTINTQTPTQVKPTTTKPDDQKEIVTREFKSEPSAPLALLGLGILGTGGVNIASGIGQLKIANTDTKRNLMIDNMPIPNPGEADTRPQRVSESRISAVKKHGRNKVALGLAVLALGAWALWDNFHNRGTTVETRTPVKTQDKPA